MAEVARFYGYEPNRAGFLCCPFHGEKTPSLKLYEKRWHCFGCQAHGDALDFAGKLFGLSAPDALRKLNADFGLCLPLDRPPTRQERARQQEMSVERAFEAWRQETIERLWEAVQDADAALRFPMEEWTPAQECAVKLRPELEYLGDILKAGSLDEQMQVFRVRKEVERKCLQALGRISMK